MLGKIQENGLTTVTCVALWEIPGSDRLRQVASDAIKRHNVGAKIAEASHVSIATEKLVYKFI